MGMMNDKERDALNRKLNNPEEDVKCPRCGNVIIYEKRAILLLSSVRLKGAFMEE